MKHVYAIEGLDRLGKSTLIEGIRDKLGYYEVIHFKKPEALTVYEKAVRGPHEDRVPNYHLFQYQQEAFRNSMLMAKSGARLIFDRWHLGEAVYAPLYRGYSGDYVFDLEVITKVVDTDMVRLVLLWEDFGISTHFVDDGKSLGPIEKRREEQDRFMGAFVKSNIRDKRMVCVTSPDGGFKSKAQILSEVLE